MRTRVGTAVLTALAIGAAGLVAACGSSGSSNSNSTGSGSTSSSSSSSSSVKQLKVLWTYTGPKNDGGYNTSQEVVMNYMNTLPGVHAYGIYNMPYSSQSTQIINQAITGGANVVVDTIGLGTLLTTACKQAPQVYCYSGGDAGPQPSNSVSWWPADWNLAYAGGAAAGLMTKTNTVGVVAPSKIPIAIQDINNYALGCQSVNPKCSVRVIFINNYYDPPADSQAATSLINAGADVIRNFIDDPGFCQVAAKHHVYAVGEFNDFASACPSSIITSTVWYSQAFFKQQVKDIQNGSFKGTGNNPIFIPVTNSPDGPHLGAFGSFVPANVKSKVMAVFQKLVNGQHLIAGPIYDQSGKLRIPAGQAPSDHFLFNWNWFVKGVTTSG
jgi:basic membrane protein A and related proteins